MGLEAQEQAALIEWCRWNAATIPELALIFHIPNGGTRNKAEAARLKAEGVKSGVPDLFLPAARGGWHGLFIEMKAGKNKTTANQNAWLAALSAAGYKTVVCYGCLEAAKTIKEYLKGG